MGEKSVIFTQAQMKTNIVRHLRRRGRMRKRKSTQKQRDRRTHQAYKHRRAPGSNYHFQRIETLVKNKHSKMKHWSKAMQRRKNPMYRKKLNEQLRGVNVLLIVRIHRKKNIPHKLLSKMHTLRLFQPWDAVIVRKTATLQFVLRDILPFVTFGVPSKEIIRDLILKRGRFFAEDFHGQKARKKMNRIVIKSNVIIEKVLGKYNVICMEDMIDALHAQNDEKNTDAMVELENGTSIKQSVVFDGVANALNPFNLNAIAIPMKGLRSPFNKLGYWGYRGTFINSFVEKIV